MQGTIRHDTAHGCVCAREREEGKVSSCFILSKLILITVASGVRSCHFLLSSAPSQSCLSSVAKMKPWKCRAGRQVYIKSKPIVHNQDSVHTVCLSLILGLYDHLPLLALEGGGHWCHLTAIISPGQQWKQKNRALVLIAAWQPSCFLQQWNICKAQNKHIKVEQSLQSQRSAYHIYTPH